MDEPTHRNNPLPTLNTSTQPKALLAATTLTEVPEEGEETSFSTSDVHGSTIRS